MKKALYWLTAGLLATAAGGCNTFLDPAPVDRQPGDVFLNSPANVEAVLASAYDALQSGDFYGGQIQRVGALYGDDLDVARVTGQFVEDFRTRNFGIFNGPGRSLWANGYKAIYRSNIVIKAVNDNTANAPAADNDRRKGEALFLRGLAQFELVRLFALPFTAGPDNPGIVLRLTPSTTEEATVPTPRSTVGQVYAQVIDDLNQAVALLPATSTPGRTNKLAARAILARVYFNQADYSNAFTQADAAIAAATTAGITLGTADSTGTVAPFRSVGAQQTPGTVFQIVNTASDDATNDLRSVFYSSYGPAQLTIDTLATGPLALFENGDLRKRYLFSADPGDLTNRIPTSLKFQGGDPVNVPIIRLPELLLTRAESRVQRGSFAAPDVRADLNAVRTHAGLAPDNTTTDATTLLTKIRRERRLEFLFENDRYHELRRLKSANIRGRSYNDPSALLKIPASETSANPAIVQN